MSQVLSRVINCTRREYRLTKNHARVRALVQDLHLEKLRVEFTDWCLEGIPEEQPLINYPRGGVGVGHGQGGDGGGRVDDLLFWWLSSLPGAGN